jgi:hypothetical protein
MLANQGQERARKKTRTGAGWFHFESDDADIEMSRCWTGIRRNKKELVVPVHNYLVPVNNS